MNELHDTSMVIWTDLANGGCYIRGGGSRATLLHVADCNTLASCLWVFFLVFFFCQMTQQGLSFELFGLFHLRVLDFQFVLIIIKDTIYSLKIRI